MSADSPINPTDASLETISPAKRKRLQQFFQFGQDKSKVGDHDYANNMYSQCVANDPSNLVYVEAFFDNLNAKFAGKKKKCRVKSSRNSFKAAQKEEDWRDVIKEGLELLAENPWDVPTLRGIASACEELKFNEVELRYLKQALDSAPKDVDVNRHCATSLARMGQFDQAIACWHRIEEDVKSEAHKHISDLTIAKTRIASGLDPSPASAEVNKSAAANTKSAPAAESKSDSSESDSSNDVASSESKTQESKTQETEEPPIVRNEAFLQDLISQFPEDIDPYLELADLYDSEQRYTEAEAVMNRALAASGNVLRVRERLEKAQIRRAKAQLKIAERRYAKDPTDDGKQLVAKLKTTLNRLELSIYDARVQRYPDETRLKYELAVRLKRAENFEEAAKYFEQAVDYKAGRPHALLARGECLQQMRQYTAALQLYEQASEEAAGKDEQVEHMALYRAGVLATGLKDSERARNWLKKLLEMNPDFRDAKARLEKLG